MMQPNNRTHRWLLLLGALVFSAPLLAGWQEGVDAYEEGNYRLAIDNENQELEQRARELQAIEREKQKVLAEFARIQGGGSTD